MVVEIRDDDMPLRVDCDVVRPGQVMGLAAARAELGEETLLDPSWHHLCLICMYLGEEFAVELKDVDARGLVVHHDQVPRGVDRDPLWPEQLPAADATHKFA